MSALSPPPYLSRFGSIEIPTLTGSHPYSEFRVRSEIPAATGSGQQDLERGGLFTARAGKANLSQRARPCSEFRISLSTSPRPSACTSRVRLRTHPQASLISADPDNPHADVVTNAP